MYYPYLRGRQYELIGLRELCENELLSNVVPVIEPVKASSTLLSTLKTFQTKKKDIILIMNPTVGTFQKEIEYDNAYKEKFDELLNSCKENITFGYILGAGFPREKKLDNTAVAFCMNMDQVQFFNDLQMTFKYVFIPDSSSAKRKIKDLKILFEDRFEAKKRNADYAEDDDSFFSNDFFYYRDENFSGFSDFSIVGNEYTESGFAPYAVAIHIVYKKVDDELRIHHFVSNSNDDINNPQKKFAEALRKLVEFDSLNKYSENKTFALKQFYDLNKNKVYPGLGTIKKLSIMHHIELVSNCLSNIGEK